MSGNPVYNDPVRLRDFSQSLGQFASLVEDVRESLDGNLGRLGETWRDEQFEEFCGAFVRVQHLLDRFLPVARQSVSDLNADAAIIEEFQRSGAGP